MKKILLLIILFGTTLMFSNSKDQQLSATMVGYNSYNKNLKDTSILITQGDTFILIDMGVDTSVNLNKLGVNINEVSTILFTNHFKKNSIVKSSDFFETTQKKELTGLEVFYIKKNLLLSLVI